MDDDVVERPEFHATKVRVMLVTPGNYDHAEGERAVIMTIAKGTDIEPMVFPLEDAKHVVTKLLVALATYNDEFAQRLLDTHFPADDNDDFIWPKGRPSGF